MSLFSILSSILRHGTNGNAANEMEVENMTTNMTTTRLQLPKLIHIQGDSGYNAFRRFLFKSAYPQADRELFLNPRILIERDEKPGRIYVEADGKETLYQAEEHIRIISIRYVIGIIYQSRSGNTVLRWRDNKPTGKVWGHVTPRSLGTLLSCSIHVKAAPSMPTISVAS